MSIASRSANSQPGTASGFQLWVGQTYCGWSLN
jgi:hypothetical protein